MGVPIAIHNAEVTTGDHVEVEVEEDIVDFSLVQVRSVVAGADKAHSSSIVSRKLGMWDWGLGDIGVSTLRRPTRRTGLCSLPDICRGR